MRHSIFMLALAAAPVAVSAQPSADYQALLAADRAHSDAAKGKDLVAGLSAIFASDAVMVAGGVPDLVRGADAIRNRLAAKPENAVSAISWSPVGGGIAADGSQGYTYGSLTVVPKGGAPIPQKYLAYWIKRPEGWRVFAYKRTGRREVGSLTPAPAVLGSVARRADDAGATLKASEKAFSDEAQVIGLRAAFQKWGRPDSVNIGAAETIAVGAQAIGEGVSGPEPTSSVQWAADEVLVAPSGDMGITYGLLHLKQAPAGQPSTIPFFTIWARPNQGDAWRYVAE